MTQYKSIKIKLQLQSEKNINEKALKNSFNQKT